MSTPYEPKDVLKQLRMKARLAQHDLACNREKLLAATNQYHEGAINHNEYLTHLINATFLVHLVQRYDAEADEYARSHGLAG